MPLKDQRRRHHNIAMAEAAEVEFYWLVKRRLLFPFYSAFSLDHDNYYYAPRMAPHHHHNAHVPGISSHLDHGQSAAEHETPHERRRKKIMLAETIIRWYWVVLVVNYFIMILIIHRIYNNSISTIPEPCVRPLLSYTETLR